MFFCNFLILEMILLYIRIVLGSEQFQWTYCKYLRTITELFEILMIVKFFIYVYTFFLNLNYQMYQFNWITARSEQMDGLIKCILTM